jgi:hypothetical protein
LNTGVVYPGKFFTRCKDASLSERELELEMYGPSSAWWALAGSAKRVLFPSVIFYRCNLLLCFASSIKFGEVKEIGGRELA